jgi:uncharacterized protein YabN with tetrapyrrole methylase and pyrophosphatase domain
LANKKFRDRMTRVESIAVQRGIALEELTPLQVDALWEEAKQSR